jgi:hypothetical protein
MTEIPKHVTKKTAFLLFNLLSLVYLAVTDRLHCDLSSVVRCVVAFTVMNVVAYISARNFRGTHRGW